MKGATFHVNNSSDILIWKDPWIPTLPNFKPVASSLNPNSLCLNLVKDLIDFESSTWNPHALNSSFSTEVVNEILKIQISPLASPKTLFWNPSKSGNFSSKSAYIVDQSNRFSPNTHPTGFNWKKLWNSKLHNRHKLFLWRIINNIFPTKARLHYIFHSNDLYCPLCNNDVEDIDHLFIKCPFIQQIWFISKWNFHIDFFHNNSVKDWLTIIFDDTNDLFYSDFLRE